MLRLSANFQCQQVQRQISVMFSSSQGTLQQSCKQDHYEKGVRHGKIWTNVYDDVLKLMCNCKMGYTKELQRS